METENKTMETINNYEFWQMDYSVFDAVNSIERELHPGEFVGGYTAIGECRDAEYFVTIDNYGEIYVTDCIASYIASNDVAYCHSEYLAAIDEEDKYSVDAMRVRPDLWNAFREYAVTVALSKRIDWIDWAISVMDDEYRAMSDFPEIAQKYIRRTIEGMNDIPMDRFEKVLMFI